MPPQIDSNPSTPEVDEVTSTPSLYDTELAREARAKMEEAAYIMEQLGDLNAMQTLVYLIGETERQLQEYRTSVVTYLQDQAAQSFTTE